MNLSYFKDENGEFKARPETKNAQSLDRVIALNKPDKVINLFAEMVVAGEQWDWLDYYKNHLNVVLEIESHNDSLPSLVNDGENTFKPEPKKIPELIEQPELKTVDQVLAPYYSIRRKARYPELSEFADAFVKSQDGDNEMLDAYVAKCKSIKESIPKP